MVAACMGPACVERSFRWLNTTYLEVRPRYTFSAEYVRGHVFLCMLANYLEWRLRRKLAPLLFEGRKQAMAKAQVSLGPRRRPPASVPRQACRGRGCAPCPSTWKHRRRTMSPWPNTISTNPRWRSSRRPCRRRRSPCLASIRTRLFPITWQVDFA